MTETIRFSRAFLAEYVDRARVTRCVACLPNARCRRLSANATADRSAAALAVSGETSSAPSVWPTDGAVLNRMQGTAWLSLDHQLGGVTWNMMCGLSEHVAVLAHHRVTRYVRIMEGHVILRSRTWSRWKGTRDDLVRIAEEAKMEVQAAARGATPTQFVQMEYGRGATDTYDSSAAFQQALNELGRRTVKRIQVAADSAGDNGPAFSTEVTFSKSRPAVTVETKGTDRREVDGIQHRLDRLVDEGRQWDLNTVFGFILGGLFGLGFSLLLTGLDWAWLPSGTLGNVLAGLIILIGYGLLLLLFSQGIPWLLPAFELLGPEDKPRSSRVRAAVLALGGTIATGVIVALVTAPFD